MNKRTSTLIAVVMGALLVINIGWPRQEVYDPAGSSWFLKYFAVIFVALTLIVGFLAYRVVKDREGAPDPGRRPGPSEKVACAKSSKIAQNATILGDVAPAHRLRHAPGKRKSTI